MVRLRLAVGLLAAAVFIALAAPLAAWTGRFGASVVLHRWLCVVLRLHVRRYGAPALGPRLIVANHVSWLDVLALGAMEPMAFLAKREVGANPWTRWLVDLQGMVYVDRARWRGLPEVNAEMARRMAAGGPVTLFAEATTSDGTRLLRLRSSHFEAARQAQACVQPVYLDYRALGGLVATRSEKPLVAWYGDMTFLPSLRRVLACGGVACDVHYGAPIAHDPATDRKALARRTELALRELKEGARAALPGGRVSR